MLGRPGEAHDPTDERVVATVRPVACLRCKQFVETVRWLFSPARWHVEAQGPQTRCRHRDDQRRFALAACRQIDKPLAHELMTGKISGHVEHPPIVDVPTCVALTEDRAARHSPPSRIHPRDRELRSIAAPPVGTFWTAVQRREGRHAPISSHEPFALQPDAKHPTTVSAVARGVARGPRSGASDTALPAGQRRSALRARRGRAVSTATGDRRRGRPVAQQSPRPPGADLCRATVIVAGSTRSTVGGRQRSPSVLPRR